MRTINGGVIRRFDLPLASGSGVVHVVDRVLAPATAGDIIATLRGDPEGRFTTLLKALRVTKLDREIGDYSSELVVELISVRFPANNCNIILLGRTILLPYLALCSGAN